MVVFYYLYYYYYLFRTRPSAELRYPVRADHPKGRRAFTMGANGGSLEGSKYPAIWRMSCRTLLGVPGGVPIPKGKVLPYRLLPGGSCYAAYPSPLACCQNKGVITLPGCKALVLTEVNTN